MKITTISICAKCSDMFSATLVNEDGTLAGDYDGYVPDFMPGDHYGDYVQLEIDLATGHILNWKKPTQEQLKALLKKDGED
jgi:hypothetical protein